MRAVELEYRHEVIGTRVIVTFSDKGGGVVNCSVSVRQEGGLEPVRMERYVSTWMKWGAAAIKAGGKKGNGIMPPLPEGWC